MKRLLKNLTAAALALALCFGGMQGMGVTARADDMTEFLVEATYMQSEARSMLPLVNEFRTGNEANYTSGSGSTVTVSGLADLEYDYDLEAVAMQRAAEIAIEYSETRPDGTGYNSAKREFGYTFSSDGENIAYGTGSLGSMESIFDSWKEDGAPYSGQADRRNMLGGYFAPSSSLTYDKTGIACVYYSGRYFWVQEFARSSNVSTPTAALDGRQTVSVKVPESSLGYGVTEVPESYSMGVNHTFTLPREIVTYTPRYSDLKTTSSNSSLIDWLSSDASVASVSNGTLTARRQGKTTLTATVNGTPYRITVDVRSETKDSLAVRRGSIYYFSNTIHAGDADVETAYGKADDQVLFGDWDGDGVDTYCVRRGNVYFFRNSLTSGEADEMIAYGTVDDDVLVGDWDGDGRDTLAVRRGQIYFFKNSIEGGEADEMIAYGKEDDIVLAGDWDGDWKDTLAVRRAQIYYFKNSIEGGEADSVIAYGRPEDAVLVGDWDGDWRDTLAARRGAMYYIKNSIGGGEADREVVYGRDTDEVYAGKWE